jgi:crotonobetainyl-CoA:carnitine CoA-transferase CaiB-like acyl-CoA transferase
MSALLEGIRVLDLSRYISGPYCAMLLGDMGAEVIKVEKTKTGEDSRSMGPFVGKISLYFTQYNKNKKSITLNTRNSDGFTILKSLIKKSDVLIENFRPGTLDKMGLNRETLDELNPNLIVTSISGFGQTGPYRGRTAFDCIAQCMSGLVSLTGEENGPSYLTGTWVVDFVTAIYAALGTVAALYHRRDSNVGQQIDVSLLDCITSILATTIPQYTTSGVIEKRWGNRDKVTCPANTFRTEDGIIYIHAGTQPLFTRLVQIMGVPELLLDTKFDTVVHRMENIQAVEAVVAEWTSHRTCTEIEELLGNEGIPVSPVNDISQIVKNPQALHRKIFEYIDYPDAGQIAINGISLKFSKTPGSIRHKPPLLGEHNEEIYGTLLGFDAEKILELRQKGTI